MGIPMRNLLGVTMVVIHIAGQQFLANWQFQLTRYKSVIAKMAITHQDILKVELNSFSRGAGNQ